jgi:formylglycine-generating enzyme required for sulfatase activity
MSFDKNSLFLLITGLIALCSTTLAQTNDIEQLQKQLNACLKSRPKIVAIAKDARRQLKECETQGEESQKLAQQEIERLKAQYEAALQQERRLKAQLEAQLKALRQRVAEAEREVKRLKTQSLKNQPKPVVVPQPSQPDEFAPGKVFRDRLADGSLGPEMVWIPAGSFRMGDIQGGGDSDEQPVHRVSVGRFAMGRYEVTNAEFVRFLNAVNRRGSKNEPWFETKAEDSDSHITGSTGNFRVESGYERHPVIEVSWYGAVAYAEWLSQQTGKTYRLPTEAEWEYAARAGTETKYWWGNEIGSNNANCSNGSCKDRFRYTAPVGSFAANPFNLFDILGNVWEWTCSEYESKYSGQEQRCAKNVNKNNRLSLRGGSWDDVEAGMRSANRYGRSPTIRNGGVGLRVARLLTL